MQRSFGVDGNDLAVEPRYAESEFVDDAEGRKGEEGQEERVLDERLSVLHLGTTREFRQPPQNRGHCLNTFPMGSRAQETPEPLNRLVESALKGFYRRS